MWDTINKVRCSSSGNIHPSTYAVPHLRRLLPEKIYEDQRPNSSVQYWRSFRVAALLVQDLTLAYLVEVGKQSPLDEDDEPEPEPERWPEPKPKRGPEPKPEPEPEPESKPEGRTMTVLQLTEGLGLAESGIKLFGDEWNEQWAATTGQGILRVLACYEGFLKEKKKSLPRSNSVLDFYKSSSGDQIIIPHIHLTQRSQPTDLPNWSRNSPRKNSKISWITPRHQAQMESSYNQETETVGSPLQRTLLASRQDIPPLYQK